MSDNDGAEDLAGSAVVARARRLANASVALGILAFALPWAGAAAFHALGFQTEWRAPFVAGLVPVSYVPFAGVKLAALVLALAAIVMGHLSISRGGGSRSSLIGALVACPAAALVVLWLLYATGIVRPRPHQGISLYWLMAFPSLFAAVAAFVLVHLASTRLRRVPQMDGVVWRPVLGTLLSYFNVAFIAIFALPYVAGKWGVNLDMSVCSRNLRGIESVLREYAEAHGETYPPLSPQSGVLMFAAEAVAQNKHIGSLLTCPTIRYAKQPATGSASPFDDQSYFYLGYALRNDDAVEAFAKAYRKKIAEGGTFDEDLVVEDAEGRHVLHRLTANAKEVLQASQDALSVSPYEGRWPAYQSACVTDDVPILIERDLGHRNVDSIDAPQVEGAWVLYLNNGVQFVERGTWPLTETTQGILAELAQ